MKSTRGLCVPRVALAPEPLRFHQSLIVIAGAEGVCSVSDRARGGAMLQLNDRIFMTVDPYKKRGVSLTKNAHDMIAGAHPSVLAIPERGYAG